MDVIESLTDAEWEESLAAMAQAGRRHGTTMASDLIAKGATQESVEVMLAKMWINKDFARNLIENETECDDESLGLSERLELQTAYEIAYFGAWYDEYKRIEHERFLSVKADAMKLSSAIGPVPQARSEQPAGAERLDARKRTGLGLPDARQDTGLRGDAELYGDGPGRVPPARGEPEGVVGKVIDPTDLKDIVLVVAGRIAIAKGGYTFAQWAKGAVAAYGEGVKPHIQDIWDRANAHVDSFGTSVKADELKPSSAVGPLLLQERTGMNAIQKCVLGLGAVAMVAALLVAPYSGSRHLGYHFIFTPPAYGSIQYGQVAMTVLAVGVVTAAAWVLLRDAGGLPAWIGRRFGVQKQP